MYTDLALISRACNFWLAACLRSLENRNENQTLTPQNILPSDIVSFHCWPQSCFFKLHQI